MKNFFVVILCTVMCIALLTSCEEQLNDDTISKSNTTYSQNSEDNITLDSIYRIS